MKRGIQVFYRAIMVCLLGLAIPSYAEDSSISDQSPVVTSIRLSDDLRHELGENRASFVVDPALPPWQPDRHHALTVIVKGGGSGSADLIAAWKALIEDRYPTATVVHHGGGSSQAIPSLMAGKANLGMMTRLPKPDEQQAFHQRYPSDRLVCLPIAFDALGLYVNAQVGIQQLTLHQVRGIYASGEGGTATISNWSAVGGPNCKIVAAVPASSNGSYGAFKLRMLDKGDYATNLMHSPKGSSWYTLQVVSSQSGGIGFGPLAVSQRGGDKGWIHRVRLIDPNTRAELLPSIPAIMDKRYPMGSVIWLVAIRDRNGHLVPALREFLALVYSHEGQDMVRQMGFIPVPESLARRVRTVLDGMTRPLPAP